MVKIRYYADSDYPKIKEVLQEGNLFDDVWEDRKNLQNKIKKDPESILVAEEDDKVVGCIFIVEDGWNAFLWRLAVKKTHRKRGIGEMLMKNAEDIIRKRGFKEVSGFVDTKNDSLKNWYAKQKYIKTKDYTFIYKKLSD